MDLTPSVILVMGICLCFSFCCICEEPEAVISTVGGRARIFGSLRPVIPRATGLWCNLMFWAQHETLAGLRTLGATRVEQVAHGSTRVFKTSMHKIMAVVEKHFAFLIIVVLVVQIPT